MRVKTSVTKGVTTATVVTSKGKVGVSSHKNAFKAISKASSRAKAKK
jgi:hypothetical protein